jgi:hypothetical protein
LKTNFIKVSALIFFTVQALLANAQTQLQLNVPSGFKASCNNTTKVDINMMGKKIKSNTKMYIRLKLVEQLPNKNFKFESVLDSFEVANKMGGNDSYINSNNKASMEAAKESPQMKAVIDNFDKNLGKAQLLTVTPTGKIIKEEGAEANIAEVLFIEFSDSPVKIKDSWQRESSAEMMGQSMQTESVYTVKSIGADNVILSVAATNSMLGDKPINSEYTVDTKTGMVKAYTMKMKMMGMMNVETTVILNW